jgi:hypothetical protein
MTVELPDLEAWFSESHGFPQPDWRAIAEWIEANVSQAEAGAAWEQCVRSWLQRIASRLGEQYSTAESENFHLTSYLPVESRRSKLAFLEAARSRMCEVLGENLSKTSCKHVVLRFSDQDDFYAYISHFHADGEFAGAGGMFLNDGYPHIAYGEGWTDQPEAPVLVHELAHNLMAHLPLPLWLNEALAMLFETEIGASYIPPLTREDATRHREYWTAVTIQDFWSGGSFSDVGGQELAYSLARILLHLVHTEIRPAKGEFRRFVLAATWADAGATAAAEHLGIQLEDIAAAFLGPGEWAPQPESWPSEESKHG